MLTETMVKAVILLLLSAVASKPVARDSQLSAGQLFEGDMAGMDDSSLFPGRASYGYTSKKLQWDDGKNHTRSHIASAMRGLRNGTCLTFSERIDEQNFIFFTPDHSSWSYVGNQRSGNQTIGLLLTGLSVGVIQHELMHVLGFLHEQARVDRDEYVDILHGNMLPSPDIQRQFAKYSDPELDSFGQPYDFESLMHYSSSAFARDYSLPTIQPKNKYRNKRIGQMDGPSAIDMRKINLMYHCKGRSLCAPIVTSGATDSTTKVSISSRKPDPSDDEGLVAYTTTQGVWILPNVNGSTTQSYQIHKSTGLVEGIAADCAGRYVYWAEMTNHNIKRARYDGSQAEVVIPDVGYTYGLALDPVSKTIFWIDVISSDIKVAKLTDPRAGYKSLIQVNLAISDSVKIAVHSSRGTLYWTDSRGLTIKTAFMDGSGVKTLVTSTSSVTGLALNYQAEELCWSAAGQMSCLNLDKPTTTQRSVRLKDTDHLSDIAFHDDRTYWLEGLAYQKTIRSMSRGDGDTANAMLHSLGTFPDDHYVGYMTIIPPHCPQHSNACAVNNGRCKYLCLPSFGGRRTCACPDGISASLCAN